MNIKNKKAIELIWSTWVIIILSILILLFLIVFFTTSSASFTNNIKSYFSKTNIDSVVKACNILVQTESNYDFCCDKKKVIYLIDNNKKESDFTCSELVSKDFINNEIINKLDCSEDICSNGLRLNQEICEDSGGKWESCASICGIINQGKTGIRCPAVCDEICKCGTIAGLKCPQGFVCITPNGVADATGYCKIK